MENAMNPEKANTVPEEEWKVAHVSERGRFSTASMAQGRLRSKACESF